MNFSKNQSLSKGYKQVFVNRVDLHIYCSVFHADHHDMACFSKIDYCSSNIFQTQPRVHYRIGYRIFLSTTVKFSILLS